MRAKASFSRSWYLRSSMLGMAMGTIISSAGQLQAETHLFLPLGGDEPVLDGRDGGLCVGGIGLHLDGSNGYARLPQLQRFGDAVLNLEAGGDGVGFEQELAQTAAECGQVEAFALLGFEDDLNGFANVGFAFAPNHAAVCSDTRWKAHTAAVELSSI